MNNGMTLGGSVLIRGGLLYYQRPFH